MMGNETHAPAETSIANSLKQAEDFCTRNGYRLTATRKRVLHMLLEKKSPTKAYDLLADLSAQGASGPPTVYRALKFLVEVGLVHRIESLNSYFACGHWLTPHSAIFLICDMCGETHEMHSPDTISTLKKSAGKERFAMRTSVIETYGSCINCQV